jgi:ABC-2 type transport system permease protein
MNKKKNIRAIAIVIVTIVLINIASAFYFFRLDLTSEKRYSISDNTKNLLKNLDSKLSVVIYLDGDLNSGFLRLKKSTSEMLDEFKVYGGKKITYSFINPSAAESNEQRIKNYQALEKLGIRGTMVYEKNSEGEEIQKVVFPWARIISGKDTINVNLLKNISGNSGDENLNISTENLEFELTDAMRVITNKTVQKIAFIEGHDELPEILTFDITKTLSRYFEIDRGVLGNDPAILKPYKAIIIAKPQKKFTESDKYIIDQYVMNGGRVLWLLDGARVSMDTLATYGVSPAIYQDVNLNDQLFRYGVRVNPVLVQDVQCASIPVNKARDGEAANYQPAPWYYAPLLQPSPDSPISRNIANVKGEFASSIDFVGDNPKIQKDILLCTSKNSRAMPAPMRVGLEILSLPADPSYFNQKYLPVAVSLDGVFPSVFANRMAPPNILSAEKPKKESVKTRMVVIADGAIIRNEVRGVGSNAQPLPLGYDSYMNQEFGNKNFILNSVLYLTDDDGWLNLRSRELKLRLLDKVTVNKDKKFLQMSNVLFPVFLLLGFAIINFIIRKRKYTR